MKSWKVAALSAVGIALIASIAWASGLAAPFQSAGGVQSIPQAGWGGTDGGTGYYISPDGGMVYHAPNGVETLLGSGGGGGGSIGGSIANTQVAVGSGTNTINGSANLTWANTTGTMALGGTTNLIEGSATPGLTLQDSSGNNTSVVLGSASIGFEVTSTYFIQETTGQSDIITSSHADGSSAQVLRINTTSAWSNAGAELASFQNSGTEKSRIAFDGSFTQSNALAIGTAQTAGITLANTTAATSGNQQYSPGIVLSGSGWSTGSSASQTVKWMIQTRPFQGGPSYANEDLVIYNNVNNAGFVEQFRLTNDAQNALSMIGGPAATAAIGFQASAGYLFSSTLAVGGSAPVVYWTGANFNPFTDNNMGLGQINKRWAGIFNGGAFSCGRNAQSGTTYTTAATDCKVVMTNSAARTVTLLTAASYPAGGYVEIWDGIHTAGSANISVARSGSDTINGATSTVAVVSANNAHSTCTSDGVSAWICGTNN